MRKLHDTDIMAIVTAAIFGFGLLLFWLIYYFDGYVLG